MTKFNKRNSYDAPASSYEDRTAGGETSSAGKWAVGLALVGAAGAALYPMLKKKWDAAVADQADVAPAPAFSGGSEADRYTADEDGFASTPRNDTTWPYTTPAI